MARRERMREGEREMTEEREKRTSEGKGFSTTEVEGNGDKYRILAMKRKNQRKRNLQDPDQCIVIRSSIWIKRYFLRPRIVTGSR